MKTWKKSSRLRAGLASTALILPLAVDLSACGGALSGSGSTALAERSFTSAAISLTGKSFPVAQTALSTEVAA